MKKATGIFLLFSFVALAVYMVSCKEMGTIDCPPKTVYYKHPQKFYPEAVKTTSVTINNVVSVLDKVHDSANVVITPKAQLLKSQLNQFGSLTEDLIKGAFISSNSRPCDVDAKKRLDMLIAKAQDQNFEIQRAVKDPNSIPVNQASDMVDSLSKLIQKFSSETHGN